MWSIRGRIKYGVFRIIFRFHREKTSDLLNSNRNKHSTNMLFLPKLFVQQTLNPIHIEFSVLSMFTEVNFEVKNFEKIDFWGHFDMKVN